MERKVAKGTSRCANLKKTSNRTETKSNEMEQKVVKRTLINANRNKK